MRTQAIRDYNILELGSAHGGVSMRAHRHASRSATGGRMGLDDYVIQPVTYGDGRTGVGAAMHAVSTVPVTYGHRSSDLWSLGQKQYYKEKYYIQQRHA